LPNILRSTPLWLYRKRSKLAVGIKGTFNREIRVLCMGAITVGKEITGTLMLPVVGMSNTSKQLMIILPVTSE